jgi:hypothetical protein
MPEPITASFVFRHTRGALDPGTPFLLGTDQATVGMPGQDGNQVLLSRFPYSPVIGDHPHPVAGVGDTGPLQFGFSFHCHHAQAAFFSRRPGKSIFDPYSTLVNAR